MGTIGWKPDWRELGPSSMCVTVGRKPGGGWTAGPGCVVAVRAGRAAVGRCGLAGRAGWCRSVELDGRAGCSGCGLTVAGRPDTVGPVGGTERAREDGQMSDGRVWQEAAGRGHVGWIMCGLGTPIGL